MCVYNSSYFKLWAHLSFEKDARNGAHVFGCDLNLTSAQNNASRIQSVISCSSSSSRHPTTGSVTVHPADVTKEDDVKTLVEACMKKFGRIDVLVNNVGLSMPGDPATMEPRIWDNQVDVNLK